MSQSGRSQLKGLLDDLVLQTTEDTRDTSPLQVDEDVEEAARELLEYSSPRKLHNFPLKTRKTRKRSQRNSTTDAASYNDEEPYISSNDPIVVYGRQLNLSRLADNPSLYSVGREWVKNDPCGQRNDEYSTNMEFNTESDIYRLPTQDFQECVASDQSLLPSLPKLDTDKMDASLKLGISPDQFQSLRQEHIMKWKRSRERYKERCRMRQNRYRTKIQTLQEMYHQR